MVGQHRYVGRDPVGAVGLRVAVGSGPARAAEVGDNEPSPELGGERDEVAEVVGVAGGSAGDHQQRRAAAVLAEGKLGAVVRRVGRHAGIVAVGSTTDHFLGKTSEDRIHQAAGILRFLARR